MAGTVGCSGNVQIHGAGVDRDGRGGLIGGSDIDATGAGLTSGQGTFDAIPIHGGSGRNGLLNDWNASSQSASTAMWSQGSSLTYQDLLGPGLPASNFLVPSPSPPYAPGDSDALGDSSIDGGPGTTVMDDPVPNGTGNVLDGLTMTFQNWEEHDRLSLNWFMTDAAGNPIGTAGIGNPFGFGTMNLVRIPEGSTLPGGIFNGNTGSIRDRPVFSGRPI
ncbi:MAG: hypothetical protein AAF456_12400 [Planctomycetota bacterium]